MLKPGAKYVILDTNPDTTGIMFSTFRSGEPGRRYEYGEEREVHLFLPDKRTLVLHDYHWPKEMYFRVLKQAGFKVLDVLEPTTKDVPKHELEQFASKYALQLIAEANHPPFLIVVASK